VGFTPGEDGGCGPVAKNIVDEFPPIGLEEFESVIDPTVVVGWIPYPHHDAGGTVLGYPIEMYEITYTGSHRRITDT
jgi:hypothetical protein